MKNKNLNDSLIRSRTACVLLYADNEKHMKALEYIKANCDMYAYILHDKDIYDDEDLDHHIGDLKKPHYHVVVRFVQQKVLKSFAKELGIEPYFLVTDNYNHALLYLTHVDYPNKYQYDISCVEGTLKGVVESLYRKSITTEDERTNSILNILYSYTSYQPLRVFVSDVCDNGLFSDFRRSYMMYRDLYYEYMNKLNIKEYNNED